jgi:predicted helicase
LPIAARRGNFGRANADANVIFNTFAIGVSTNRDDWVTDVSRDSLLAKKKRLVAVYRDEVLRLQKKRVGVAVAFFILQILSGPPL